MTIEDNAPAFSARRSRLNGFDAAYRVAISARAASGRDHFIVRTGNLLQPFRVTSQRPRDISCLLAHVA